MHIALLAGEPSGDQLGAELIKSLRKINPAIKFDGVGGELMQAEGFHSILPMEEFSVMGLTEIVKQLPKLIKYRNKLQEIYKLSIPDAFIGIDYPEFNLNLEKRLKQSGIFTAHYVSPSVWAWRENRIHHIKDSCDLMLTLFDFEKKFYDNHNMKAIHCGHPLVDIIPDKIDTNKARNELNLEINNKEIKYLAILPGSRVSEVKKMLPVFIETAVVLNEKLQKESIALKILIPAVNNEIKDFINEQISINNNLNIIVFDKKAKKVMESSDAILLASGTAALEAMLLQKPMLVSYKVSYLTALIAKRLVKTKYFSLPNLLANNEIVPEYMQNDINYESMADELYKMLNCQSYINKVIDDLKKTRNRIQSNGSDIAAKAIYSNIIESGLSININNL